MTEDEALQIIAETIVRGEDSGANGWQTAAEILAALRADPALAAAALGPQPTVYARDDGTTRVEWPDGVTSCVVSREALDGYAEDVNGAWRALTEARRDLDALRRIVEARTEVAP